CGERLDRCAMAGREVPKEANEVLGELGDAGLVLGRDTHDLLLAHPGRRRAVTPQGVTIERNARTARRLAGAPKLRSIVNDVTVGTAWHTPAHPRSSGRNADKRAARGRWCGLRPHGHLDCSA